MSTTNYGFPLFSTNWLEQHAGLGAVDLANAILCEIDYVLPGALLYQAKIVVPISSAQLLNMKAQPIQILPALPTGKMAQALYGVLQYKPVTVDYTIGDAANLVIGSATNPASLTALQPIAAGVLTGAGGPGNVLFKIPANIVSGSQSLFEGQDLVLTHDGSAEITSGDGTAVFTLAYQTIAL